VNWIILNWPRVLSLTVDHLALSLPAIVLSIVVSIPLGRFAFMRPQFGEPLASAAALIYAIPSLPLLIIIPAVFGTPLRSSATMIIALVLYGVALLVRSATDAFASVDAGVREAAVAVGYSKLALFWKVELPLALPVLVAGIRVVAVSTISLVTIGALIGVPSLGTLLTDGFQRGILFEVATGIVVTILLAVLIDVFVRLVGRLAAPWSQPTRSLQGASA
jgi:ABC-type proline/glycine betaine transport systems, permease component